jgi:serine/threonine-protein kinase HipA
VTALDVFFHAERVGKLERLPGAKLRFEYTAKWAREGSAPLSLSLPLIEEPYEDDRCRPFFSGLLPEGEFLKSIARRFHVSADNPFAVLSEIGGECAGAVSLVAAGAKPPSLGRSSPNWLDEKGLGLLLAELPDRPLLAEPGGDDEGIRLSLSGSQDKLPVLWMDDRVGITRGHPPSTHIVKVPLSSVDDMVANEAYCMSLAAAAGLTAARARPIAAGGQEGLLVYRYDRTAVDGEGTIHRIHQEDFCQALGYYPEEKYQAHGGPGVAQCAALIRTHSAAPGADVLSFLDALVFNLLIGNADAHSKNYSLILEGDESPRLAPLYDLLSTRVYGRRFNRKMAMKYGGEYRPERIRGRHLDRLADDLGLPGRGLRRRVGELLERVETSVEDARHRLPEQWREAPTVEGIGTAIAEMAELLRRATAEPA